MVRLGQNFLADTNLLAAIVREAELAPDAVVLEVGGGEGVLTAQLAPRASHVHVVELDERLRPALEAVAGEHGNVALHFGDAMRIELGALDPPPDRMVANLPYSIATPLLLRTIDELPTLRAWTVMIQREIADRLRAAPGSRVYGSPSVLVQLACDVRLLRAVDPAVFTPRPRVASALLGLERKGPAAPEPVTRLVREAFAHRRKSLARSLELARPGSRERVQGALAELGLPERARAEELAPEQFVALAERLENQGPGRPPTRSGGGGRP
jgi:16S rRNA (adenine1518-N6/adenine1519-N6)-dimethyltransferase